MADEKKWYYVDYDTFSLPNEILASNKLEAEQIALQYVIDLGVGLTIEEMEE